MYIEQLREMVPPPSQNIVAVCNQFNLYNISSSLLALLKVIDAPTKVSDIFHLAVSFKFVKFSFHIFPLLFLKCLLSSHPTLFRLSTLY